MTTGNDKTSKQDCPWVRFWWDSNRLWRWVDSSGDWRVIVQAYVELDDVGLDTSENKLLDRALGLDRKYGACSAPSFGFRKEHCGETTLREFFKANDMPTIGPEETGQ